MNKREKSFPLTLPSPPLGERKKVRGKINWRREFLYTILVFALFIFAAGGLFAQDGVLTIESAVQEALARNPEILAAKERYKASRARIPQAFTPEDPMPGYNYK